MKRIETKVRKYELIHFRECVEFRDQDEGKIDG